MVLGKLLVPGRPTNFDYSRTRPIALAIGAGGGCLDIFSLIYNFSFLSPSLWETVRYRLKDCLKGPLHPEQPTNQPSDEYNFSFLWMVLAQHDVELELTALFQRRKH